jgi:hypothetical protein
MKSIRLCRIINVEIRIYKITISNDLVIYVTQVITLVICGLRIPVLSIFFPYTSHSLYIFYS